VPFYGMLVDSSSPDHSVVRSPAPGVGVTPPYTTPAAPQQGPGRGRGAEARGWGGPARAFQGLQALASLYAPLFPTPPREG
jgi:hypothetical protein